MDNRTYAELKAIAEKLAVVVVSDANPENWSAAGKKPAKMTAKERGDAVWSRRLAASSLSVLTKVHSVIGIVERHAGNRPPEDPIDTIVAEETKQLQRRVEEARREAARMLGEVAQRERAGGK